MSNYPLLAALSLATLAIVIIYGVFMLVKARQSQAKRGEHPGGIAGPE